MIKRPSRKSCSWWHFHPLSKSWKFITLVSRLVVPNLACFSCLRLYFFLPPNIIHHFWHFYFFVFSKIIDNRYQIPRNITVKGVFSVFIVVCPQKAHPPDFVIQCVWHTIFETHGWILEIISLWSIRMHTR